MITDPKRIDLASQREVVTWCTLLRIDEAELRAAVAQVGPMSIAVAVHIGDRKRSAAPGSVGGLPPR